MVLQGEVRSWCFWCVGCWALDGQLCSATRPNIVHTSGGCCRAAGRQGNGYSQQETYDDDYGEQPQQQQKAGTKWQSSGGGSGGGGPARGQRGTQQELEAALRRLDGAGYKGYHDVEGAWGFPGFTFILHRAQSDPFAQPSRCRVLVRAPQLAMRPQAGACPARHKHALCLNGLHARNHLEVSAGWLCRCQRPPTSCRSQRTPRASGARRSATSSRAPSLRLSPLRARCVPLLDLPLSFAMPSCKALGTPSKSLVREWHGNMQEFISL
jgi:hypothetical protein